MIHGRSDSLGIIITKHDDHGPIVIELTDDVSDEGARVLRSLVRICTMTRFRRLHVNVDRGERASSAANSLLERAHALNLSIGGSFDTPICESDIHGFARLRAGQRACLTFCRT